MGKKKDVRGEPHTDFYVYLRDKDGQVIPVGYFFAFSPGDAIERATKTYPGLFAGETRAWTPQAEQRRRP